MKLTNIIKESKTIQRENKGPCWDGYQQIGMKMKGGKEVPNCVPKNEANEASKKIPLFIPNVGNIDDFKLKSLLQKNPKVKTILGDKEFKFLNQDNTDVIMVSGKPFNSITTDGELEFELDLKKNILVKPLGKARPKIVAHYSQNKAVSEATHTSAPGEWVGFVSKEKGKKLMGVFKPATGAKSWLTKNQNSLLNQSDVRSVGIQPKKDWDAREAKYAIESVNEMNVNKKFGSKYDIGAGSMGSGTTFWNRAQEVSGDYKTIAHVSDNGKVTFYDKKLPNDVKKHIEDYAKTKSVNEGKKYELKVAKTGKYEIRYITDDFGTNIYSIFLDGLEFGDEYDGEGGVLPTDRRISIKNIEKLLKKFKNSIKESVNEGKMSDINLIAKEAANFNDFVKQFYIEYSNFPKTVESTQWLKDIYTGKTKMESVTTNVNENCGCGGAKTTNPYSLSEFVVNEGRNIQKIQKDYNDTVLKLKSTLEKYKEAKGTPNEKKWVDELKKLTVLKKKYQSELDKGVQDLYKDAEYEGE
jgi:hypothetical protein